MIEFVMDTEHPVVITSQEANLNGLLHIPRSAIGMVIFAHGSGSSRFSPRNQQIARSLQQAQFATLLFDLLTEEEDNIDTKTMEFRFDIELLAKRLLIATAWVRDNPALHKLPMAYFGASTGGAAALMAAAREKKSIKAVVSRGGRPDLADHDLTEVEAATLLIVGGEDKEVITLNEKALSKLRCVKKLVIIPGATHLFEEPGKLEEVAQVASTWFSTYLT